MKAAVGIFVLGLIAYSATLIAIELNTSQDYVRHYFSDIEGVVPFYAINTTLSTVLLAGAALLLVFSALTNTASELRRCRWLLISQAAMFGFLAFDERFQLHEALAWRIGIDDHFIMLFWAVAEAGLLVGLCRLDRVSVRTALLFAAGGAFSFVMMVFDTFVPHDKVLRLSIEDLAKTWAAASFLGAAWFAARFHLGLDPNDRTLADLLRDLRNNRSGAISPRAS